MEIVDITEDNKYQFVNGLNIFSIKLEENIFSDPASPVTIVTEYSLDRDVYHFNRRKASPNIEYSVYKISFELSSELLKKEGVDLKNQTAFLIGASEERRKAFNLKIEKFEFASYTLEDMKKNLKTFCSDEEKEAVNKISYRLLDPYYRSY